MSLVIVVEGDTDLPVVRKLAADAKLPIDLEIDAAGKGNIDRQISGWNDAALGGPWFVLRDLDSDAACAPAWIAKRKLKPATWMCFRLAVRELEAWLLADARGISEFLDVEERWVPANPDAERDPTQSLVALARRAGRGDRRRRLVPEQGSGTVVGKLYEDTIIEFATHHWDLGRACKRSDSLRRARAALRALGQRWRKLEEGRS